MHECNMKNISDNGPSLKTKKQEKQYSYGKKNFMYPLIKFGRIAKGKLFFGFIFISFLVHWRIQGVINLLLILLSTGLLDTGKLNL